MIFIMSIYQVSLKQCRDLISFLQIHNQGFKFEVMFLERCTNAFSIGIYEDEDVYIIFMWRRLYGDFDFENIFWQNSRPFFKHENKHTLLDSSSIQYSIFE